MSKPRWGGAPADKCVGCSKTVYPAEKLAMEGQIWHIECLRCNECNKKLGGANWGGFMPPDNTPYCKIHFDRIIISSGKGGASSSTAWTPKESSGDAPKSSSKFGARPTDKCEKCGKTVYPAEKLMMESRIFHIGCLRCEECNKQITGANFGGFTTGNTVYCGTHLKQLVRAAGSATDLSGPKAWTPKEKSDSDEPSKPSKWGARPTDRCEHCGKTVYPAEKFSIEGRIFHNGCLRCKECGKQLGGSNWGGFMPPENDPYCKIHFDRIIVSSGKGGISSVAEWTPKESSGDGEKPKSKWGGAPKEKCEKCGKTVYNAEKLVMEGRIFHHGCLSCDECGKKLSGANWGGFVAPREGQEEEQVYCNVHLKQLVARLGDSTLLSGAGSGGKGWTPKTSSGDGERPKSRFGGAPKEKCEKCGKSVYPAEKVSMEGRIYHGPCLRCIECNKALTGANWGAFVPPDYDPYCKTHYNQLVMARGDSTTLSGTGATGK